MNSRVAATNPAAAKRLFRLIKIGFIVYMALLFFVVIRIPSKSHRAVDPMIELALTMTALVALVAGYVAPRVLARHPQPESQDAAAAPAIKSWFSGGVIGLFFLEACSLFGVVLHFLGADLQRSELLIAAGIVSTVFFSPGALPDGANAPAEPH
jgi:hypothetical protein